MTTRWYQYASNNVSVSMCLVPGIAERRLTAWEKLTHKTHHSSFIYLSKKNTEGPNSSNNYEKPKQSVDSMSISSTSLCSFFHWGNTAPSSQS